MRRDKLLSELLDEYKETGDKELIDKFIKMLWKSKYPFRKYKKYYTYGVDEELIKDKRLVELFKQYEYIEFTFCKSYYLKKLNSIDYIRVHVNNMYGLLVDKDVYLPKEYYQLLLTPKREYYNVLELLKKGEQVSYEQVKQKIDLAMMEADEIKKAANEKKINLTWSQYKKLINSYIHRLFENYIPPHEYEEKHGWEMKIFVDGWSEDNYIIKYFCKSLTGYMRNYVRNSKVETKYCVICGKKIGRREKYCSNCYKEYRRKYKTQKQREYRNSDNVDS